MQSDYEQITRENIESRGKDFDDVGRFLSEQLYSDRTHFVYELLQNAEDALERRFIESPHSKLPRSVKFRLYKNCLEFCHYGQPFNSDDVHGISDILKGTKSRDVNQIGKFGIGFKSVYGFTSSPEIHSGDEHFVIERYIRPRKADNISQTDEGETLFIFPFNHDEPSNKEALSSISEKLMCLGPRVLLFLNQINDIKWEVFEEEYKASCQKEMGKKNTAPSSSGMYTKESRVVGENRRKIFIVSKANGKKEEAEEWLVFERPIQTGKFKVEIAFKLETDPKTNKEKIVPVDNATLVVFFPTEKETHLNFLVQGPYRTTPARDNIPSVKENVGLIEETALLAANAISEIKRMGLLKVDFFNVLPISSESFPEEHMFRSFFDRVREKLKGGEKLLPISGGGFIGADGAVLGRSSKLTSLINSRQLSQLMEKSDCKWLHSEITEDKTPLIRQYLLEELEIPEVDPEKFASLFDEDFIKNQNDNWMVKFYNFLSSQPALWQRSEHSWPRKGTIRNKPIIRLEDNSHVSPFDSENRPNAYLPGKVRSSFPTVKRRIFKDNGVEKFLISLGLPPLDEYAEIRENILLLYNNENEITVKTKENVSHVRKIICYLETCSKSRKEELLDELKETKFLLARNAKNRKELHWCKPNGVYLPKLYTDSPDLEIYFEKNPEINFLIDDYRGINLDQLVEVGCAKTVKVDYAEPENGYVEICNSHGWHVRGLDGFYSDFEVEGLEHALKNITREKARIVWNLVKKYACSIRGTIEKCSLRDFSGSEKVEMFSPGGELLYNMRWIPISDKGFHKPQKSVLSDLPRAFGVSEVESKELAKVLGFKPDIEAEYLAQLSKQEKKRIEFAKTLTEEEMKAVVDKRRSAIQETGGEGTNGNGADATIEEIDGDQLIGPFGRDDFRTAFSELFCRPRKRQPGTVHVLPVAVNDPDKRRGQVKKEIEDMVDHEPPMQMRFKRIPAKKWEDKNFEVRI